MGFDYRSMVAYGLSLRSMEHVMIILCYWNQLINALCTFYLDFRTRTTNKLNPIDGVCELMVSFTCNPSFIPNTSWFETNAIKVQIQYFWEFLKVVQEGFYNTNEEWVWLPFPPTILDSWRTSQTCLQALKSQSFFFCIKYVSFHIQGRYFENFIGGIWKFIQNILSIYIMNKFCTF